MTVTATVPVSLSSSHTQGKMTFMKKDPEVVQLYFRGGMLALLPRAPDGSPPPSAAERKEEMRRRAYPISRKEEFIKALQENLRRFK